MSGTGKRAMEAEPRAHGAPQSKKSRGSEGEALFVPSGPDSVVSVWQQHVLIRLGAPVGVPVLWSKGMPPTIANFEDLHASRAFEGCDTYSLLSDISEPTTLEAADGNWEIAVAGLGGPSMATSLAQLEGLFDKNVAPGRAQPGTRVKHWRGWRTVLTWAIAGALWLATFPPEK